MTDNHTLTVIPEMWTVEEFDKRVRGFRAALIAYGDVFKAAAAPAPVPAPVPVPVPKKPRAKPVGERLGTSYHKDILSILTRLKVGEVTFFPHVDPKYAQLRICTAACDYRKKVKKVLHVRTTRTLTPNGSPGVRVKRVA